MCQVRSTNREQHEHTQHEYCPLCLHHIKQSPTAWVATQLQCAVRCSKYNPASKQHANSAVTSSWLDVFEQTAVPLYKAQPSAHRDPLHLLIHHLTSWFATALAC
jgi:hypothetical protein